MSSERHNAIIAKGISKRYKIGSVSSGNLLHHRLEQLLRFPTRLLKALKHRELSWEMLFPSSSEYFWALKDVSFTIAHGEMVGLIGHNGAGKSALLKILSRITKPSKGYAEIRGKVRSMLEVDSGFHPELTGRENIFMSGAILGMKRKYIKSKFETIVQISEIGDFLDTPVKRYSSGMRVKLAFGVASQLKPQILILDEILAVGDHSFRLKAVDYLRSVKNRGQTVLIVSHNLNTIGELCDRVIWLDHGRIKMQGPSALVLKEYSAGSNQEEVVT